MTSPRRQSATPLRRREKLLSNGLSEPLVGASPSIETSQIGEELSNWGISGCFAPMQRLASVRPRGQFRSDNQFNVARSAFTVILGGVPGYRHETERLIHTQPCLNGRRSVLELTP